MLWWGLSHPDKPVVPLARWDPPGGQPWRPAGVGAAGKAVTWWPLHVQQHSILSMGHCVTREFSQTLWVPAEGAGLSP